MFTIWTMSNGYWQDMPYAPRERHDAERLLLYYQSNWPDRLYLLAPAGFSPSLSWCG